MKYKLLAIDLDGTTLNSNSQIPLENIKAVRAAAKTGITIAVCTGRGYHSSSSYVEQLGLAEGMPVIFRNGSFVKRTLHGDFLLRVIMSGEVAKRLAGRLIAAGLHPVICVDDRYREDIYIMERTMQDPIQENFYKLFHPHIRIVKDLLQADFATASVVGSRGDAAVLSQVKQEIDSDDSLLIRSHIILIDSGTPYFEGYEPGTNKWIGLQHIMKTLNCDPQNVIVIGDAINDLEMIQNAGYGIAMANGSEACLSVADEIAPSNDDCGVAQMIRKHILNEGR